MNRFRGREFPAFSEHDGFAVVEGQKQKIAADINGQADNYILNVNKAEYVAHLVSTYTINPLEIHADQLSVSTEERLIPAEMHPHSFYVHAGKSYPKDVLTFHLPFTGQAELLKVRASTFSMSAPRISVKGQEIIFEFINFNMDAQSIKREADSRVAQLVSQNAHLTRDLTAFNGSIEQIANQVFDARKSHLLKKGNLLSALGVPIRKSDNAPTTFAVTAKRTPAIQAKPKPVVTEKGYKPEPALDNSIYQQILKITHDVGKQFERLPSTYAGKEEEHLRDHFLLILEPNFEGSATGETFNKSGKTDILLRHDGSNIFVGELKYWRGKKGYLDTITQLLSYLTWRDSKAAVIVFVPNKEFTSVLSTIEQATTEHSNYLGFVSKPELGWYQYRFHVNGDRNREVQLAVQAFHLSV
ncbi:MAG: hypothetical protein KME07_06150 [Pegethrix bostrychoides GSE-TBD4-15B]|uniref:Uncharacterized protein n=1 Tax=Pegethrix bostrychoides GSE-TBD4-15B TaxID=2839662 RepID=A0A951P8Q4_9CYAN|nr:hypothetical protein [Pegethrix bostrychoides GSE-TBD4-15B]